MGLKITVLDTGPKTYAEELARKEVLNRVFGVTSAVMANNGTTETKRKTKNKVLSIAIDSKEITPDKIMVYKAKLDEKDKTTLKADLRAIKFGFWLEDKDKKEVKLHENVAYIIRSNKEKRYLFDITTKDDLASTDHTTDFTDTETIEEFTIALGKHAFYYAKITRTETEAILEIKFSKWMDGYRIRMEAYYRSEKPLGDGGTTTASRFVWANPEIIDTYWMNAQGKRIQETGHSQDLYLYLKTLGLTDRTITVNVYDKDYHRKPLEPSNFLGSNNGDDLIEWKNNQLKIDKREIIKQFKVGNKKRYEEAKKDETEKEYQKWYDEQIDKGLYFVGFDPIEKYGNDLELYINFPKQENLKLPRDNAFAKLVLTEKKRIAGAFFAKVEKHKVQADAPASKKKPNPTKKATQYIKIDKGVLGQTVQLVAECPNLEGKTVSFEVYEKQPFLVGEKDKALTLIHKEQEKTCIEAKVENGYAVAEIKLQHCKEDADNEDWEKLLDPDKGELKTAELYIKVEAIENVFLIKDKGAFLKDEPFELLPAVSVYKIYQKGKITKLHREGAKKGRYYYYDSSNKEHYLGKYNYKKITNNYSWNKKYGKTKKINLINLKDVENYNDGSVKFGLTMDTTRPYANEFTLASLLGAMLECGFDDFVCNGFSKKDGSSSPSVSHLNGFHGDFKYLRKDKAIKTGIGTSLDISAEPEKLDANRQNSFNDALIKFGWTKFLGWTYIINGVKHKLNHILKNTTDHHHHLHIEIYNHHFIKVSDE